MGLFKNWKPKRKIGKILKGVTIGAVGAAAVASGVGAVAGGIGGIGMLAGAAKGVGTLVKTVGGGSKIVGSKISASATKLLTGQTKEENAIIRAAKEDARTAAQSNKAVDKLMNLGLSENEAYSKLGLNMPENVKEEEPGNDFLSKLRSKFSDGADRNSMEPMKQQNKNLIYGGLGLAVLLLLPKILK